MTPALASAPALPLHTAGPYVAAAYIVFVALILIYVAIMARRLSRTQKELRELQRQLELKEEMEQAVQEAPPGSERPQERIA